MKLPKKKAPTKSHVTKPVTAAAVEPAAPQISDQLNEQRRRVDYDTFDISVQQLLAMTLSKQIDTAPAYQRQFRWKDDRQSQFIESVFPESGRNSISVEIEPRYIDLVEQRLAGAKALAATVASHRNGVRAAAQRA